MTNESLEHAICLDGSKAKKMLGFKAQIPTVEVSELKRIVEEFQKDGIWSVPTRPSLVYLGKGLLDGTQADLIRPSL